MHSTKTSHVSERDVLVALSAAQSTRPKDSANNARNEGKQTTPEGGCPQRTNSHQRPRQCFAPFFSAWKHCTTVGRASRSEFWFGFLQLSLTYLLLEQLILRVNPEICESWWWTLVFGGLHIGLDFMWTTRRLHDIGMSGLLPLVILLGTFAVGVGAVGYFFLELVIIPIMVIVIVLCLWPSQPRENKYGPVPYVE